MVFFLFQDGDTDLFAFSTDRTGANIPRVERSTQWLLRDRVIELKFAEGYDLDDFQPVLDALDTDGFYLYRGDYLPPCPPPVHLN